MAQPTCLNRRLVRTCIPSILAAMVIFSAVLTSGRFNFLQWQPAGNFYDAQARSLLDLRLDMPLEVLGIEAFVIDGRSYMYFGPIPALFRLPVTVLTDHLDGRLTQLSMLAAFAVLLFFIVRLYWHLRQILRGEAPLGRFETRVFGVYILVAGIGGVPLFLASRAWVYHEASLWGLALSLAAYDFVLTFAMTPTRRSLTLATLFATMAILTRASVGGGPVLALGLLLVGHLLVRRALGKDVVAANTDVGDTQIEAVPRAIRWLGLRPEHGDPSWLLPLAIAFLLPVLLSISVTYTKFRSPVALPFERQVATAFSQSRQEVLSENQGSIFSARFIPVTLGEYLRPDALQFSGLFPWVTFRDPPKAPVLSGVRFESVDRASSVSTTMPALLALALAGIVMFPGRGGIGTSASALVVPMLGAAAGGATVLATGAVAHRYIADVYPLLVLASVAGLHGVLRWSTAPPSPARRQTWLMRVTWVLLAILAAVGTATNLSLTLLYQGVYSNLMGDGGRAPLLQLQHQIDEQGVAGRTRVGVDLPMDGRDQDLFVIDDCAGLYQFVGESWHGVERTNATGRFRLRMAFPPSRGDAREPLVSAGVPGKGSALVVAYDDVGRVRFGYVNQAAEGSAFLGAPQQVGDDLHMIDVVFDHRLLELGVWMDGEMVFQGSMAFQPVDPDEGILVGRSDIGGSIARTFSGFLENLPVTAPVCQDLVQGKAGESQPK